MKPIAFLSLVLLLSAPVWATVGEPTATQPESTAIFQDYLGLTTDQLVALAELRQESAGSGVISSRAARAILTAEQQAKLDALRPVPADEPLIERARRLGLFARPLSNRAVAAAR